MKIVFFPNWSECLKSDVALSDSQKEGFVITIRWYLSFLKKSRQRATVQSAVAFMDWAVEKKSPPAFALDNWKLALNWFFKNAPIKKDVKLAPLSGSSSGAYSKASDSLVAGATEPAAQDGFAVNMNPKLNLKRNQLNPVRNTLIFPHTSIASWWKQYEQRIIVTLRRKHMWVGPSDFSIL